MSRDFLGSYQGSVNIWDEQAGFLDGVFHEAQDYRPGGENAFNHFIQNGIWAETNEMVSVADFTKPLSYSFAAGDQALGSFYWRTDDASGAESEFAEGQFSYSGVTITTAAVPEPATWAMMIVGFGMVGAAVRHRRPAAKTATA